MLLKFLIPYFSKTKWLSKINFQYLQKNEGVNFCDVHDGFAKIAFICFMKKEDFCWVK